MSYVILGITSLREWDENYVLSLKRAPCRGRKTFDFRLLTSLDDFIYVRGTASRRLPRDITMNFNGKREDARRKAREYYSQAVVARDTCFSSQECRTV